MLTEKETVYPGQIQFDFHYRNLLEPQEIVSLLYI